MGDTQKKIKKRPNLELTAISVAARKAGMNYGEFMNCTTGRQRRKIIEDYKRQLEKEQSL